MTTRSLTCELQPTTVSPIVMLKSLYKSCLYFDVNTMSSVLSSFSFNISWFIHSLISETHSSIRARPSRQSLMEWSIVICIGMVRQSMLLNDITNRFGVHAINSRTQHRTLWNSKVQLLIYWYRVFINNTLYPNSQIRPEPIKCIASYTVNIT